MVLNKIEDLLEKYNNAETSLKEEEQLKIYFQGNNVAPHLEHYKPLFQYFSESKHEQYTKDVSLNTKKTNMYQWISVAAVAVLMLGFLIPQLFGPSQEDLQGQEEALLAYNQTIEALSLVSLGINEGKEQLNSLALVSDSFNQGIEEAGRLGQFSKTTNKIFKNN